MTDKTVTLKLSDFYKLLLDSASGAEIEKLFCIGLAISKTGVPCDIDDEKYKKYIKIYNETRKNIREIEEISDEDSDADNRRSILEEKKNIKGIDKDEFKKKEMNESGKRKKKEDEEEIDEDEFKKKMENIIQIAIDESDSDKKKDTFVVKDLTDQVKDDITDGSQYILFDNVTSEIIQHDLYDGVTVEGIKQFYIFESFTIGKYYKKKFKNEPKLNELNNLHFILTKIVYKENPTEYTSISKKIHNLLESLDSNQIILLFKEHKLRHQLEGRSVKFTSYSPNSSKVMKNYEMFDY